MGGAKAGAKYLVAPTGGGGFTAGGDLAGTSTSQTVIGIQGRPVSSAAPSSGQVLEWNGSLWVPTTPSAGGVTSVTDDGGGSLVISPTTGAVLAGRAALTGDVTASASSNATTIKSSVGLTGAPTAPTAAPGTNTTQLASTQPLKPYGCIPNFLRGCCICANNLL